MDELSKLFDPMVMLGVRAPPMEDIRRGVVGAIPLMRTFGSLEAAAAAGATIPGMRLPWWQTADQLFGVLTGTEGAATLASLERDGELAELIRSTYPDDPTLLLPGAWIGLLFPPRWTVPETRTNFRVGLAKCIKAGVGLGVLGRDQVVLATRSAGALMFRLRRNSTFTNEVFASMLEELGTEAGFAALTAALAAEAAPPPAWCTREALAALGAPPDADDPAALAAWIAAHPAYQALFPGGRIHASSSAAAAAPAPF